MVQITEGGRDCDVDHDLAALLHGSEREKGAGNKDVLGCGGVRADPAGGDATDQSHELQPASHGGWLRSREGSYSDRYALGRREEERDVAAAHLSLAEVVEQLGDDVYVL